MGLFNANSSFASIVQTLIGLMDSLVGVLAALALVVFFFGLVRYIKDSGDAKGRTAGRERIVWSLIAIFILFSIWGILSLMNVAFFGSNLNGSSSTATYNPNGTPGFSQNLGSGVGQVPSAGSGRIQFNQ